MLKTFKRAISTVLISAFVLSLVPVVGMAEIKTVSVSWENMGWTRGGSSSDTVQTINVNRPVRINSTSGSNYRVGYAQFDLSDYANVLNNDSTKFSMDFTYPTGSNAFYGMELYIMNDKVDNYTISTLNYDGAIEIGLHNKENGELIETVYNDGAAYTEGLLSIDLNKTTLNTYLSTGSNSIITFVFFPVYADNSYLATGKLNITYDEDEIVSDQDYYDELKSELTWENLFGEVPSDGITSETVLPPEYQGIEIEWSSEPNVISDGKFVQKKDKDVSATITGTLKYGDAVTEPIFFDIKVLAEKIKTITVDANTSNIALINGGNADEVQEFSTTIYMTTGAMHEMANSRRQDEHGFIKWNLKDYIKEINAATALSLEIGNRDPAGINGVVTLLNDRSDDWDKSELTYNMAIANGMYTDPGLFTAYNVSFNIETTTDSPQKTVIDDPELLNAVKTALAQDPDEGDITFRLSSGDWNLHKIKTGGTAGYPCIKISYYESDVVDDVSKEITWDSISHQDKDNVVSDITLPDKWYGADITWSTDNSDVITNTGVVTVTEGIAQPVKLTATINDVETSFDIIVSPNKLAVKSDRKFDTDIPAINYSTGYIYANEAMTEGYTILLATYNQDNQLSNVTVVDSSTFLLGKGLNILPSKIHYAFENATTKVIIVDNTTNLTPLTKAR